MPDFLRKIRVDDDDELFVRWRDMGDGTHAEVAALGAGEGHLGQIGIDLLPLVQTPTITAGVYATNDAIGGLMTFANAARVSGGKCTIRSIVVLDKAKQDATIDLMFFDRTFTPTADNAEWAPLAADHANRVGHIKVLTSKYVDDANYGMATMDNLGLSIGLLGTSLFAQAVIRGIETYASTSDLTFKIVVERH